MVKGHVVHVPRAARRRALQLRRAVRTAARHRSSYLRLAHDFHAIVLDHVPVMDYPQRNEAKRFIALIAIYDGAECFSSAAAAPMALYRTSRRPEGEWNSTAPPRP